MTDPTIGERIRELRRPTYTQHDLAVAAEVSVDVIRKLEQGRRQTASIVTLARIAAALGVDLAALLGPPRPVVAANGDQERMSAIRNALTSVDDLLGELDGADLPDLTEFSRAVTYAWGLFWATRYGLLAAMLPRLLTEATAVTHAAAASDMSRAADLAAQVYQITAEALLHLGDAGRSCRGPGGSAVSRFGVRPLRVAAGRSALGHVLLRQGRFGDAERVYLASAADIQQQASPAHLSVHGGLLLGGASAAARRGQAGAATELLTEAGAVAQRTGTDRRDYDVKFGPGLFVMAAVDCSVVTEDYVDAARVARTMPPESALPLVSRSRHLADVAHAPLRLGRTSAAESVLLTMEQAAPEWTSHQQLPRVLVGELMTLGRPSVRLRELAQRLNATGRRP